MAYGDIVSTQIITGVAQCRTEGALMLHSLSASMISASLFEYLSYSHHFSALGLCRKPGGWAQLAGNVEELQRSYPPCVGQEWALKGSTTLLLMWRTVLRHIPHDW